MVAGTALAVGSVSWVCCGDKRVGDAGIVVGANKSSGMFTEGC